MADAGNRQPWASSKKYLKPEGDNYMLKGKKTYITAIVAIVTALGAYLSDDMSSAEALQISFSAVMAAAIRNGIIHE